MSFVSLAFLPFLAGTLLLYWSVRGFRAQNVVLVVASAVFYGWVEPWFVGLLYASLLLDWALALGMARFPARKNLLLALSVVGNLGMLGTFKYFDFFAESVAAAAAALGLHVNPPLLHLLLPAGISFYTFQALSYSIDVWRGVIAPRRSLLDLAVFLSLFPQLVAGPVERARDLLPQVEAPRRWDTGAFAEGIDLCLRGAVWKVVVADTAGLYVDRVFALPDPHGWVLWAGVIGFSVQILGDFGGYTYMARGTARMLGFRLVENFKSPYLATSPTDFWRRWHVSLSSWFHEYVYLPLRGASPGWARRSAATVASMGISGLWHGAAWHFVVWGLWHAALLVGHRAWATVAPRPLPRALAVPLMAAASVTAWLPFRESDPDRLWAHLRRPLLHGSTAEAATAIAVVAIALAGAALLRVVGTARVPSGAPPTAAAALRGLGWGAMALLVTFAARDTARDFLYFRF